MFAVGSGNSQGCPQQRDTVFKVENYVAGGLHSFRLGFGAMFLRACGGEVTSTSWALHTQMYCLSFLPHFCRQFVYLWFQLSNPQGTGFPSCRVCCQYYQKQDHSAIAS